MDNRRSPDNRSLDNGQFSTEIRGVSIEGEISGRGRPFVWGHGLTLSIARENELPMLIDWSVVGDRTQVVRYDARGHGRSGLTQEPDRYRWAELAVDQLALADHLGLDRFALGGASMGAATALHSAVIAPDRIERLLLALNIHTDLD